MRVETPPGDVAQVDFGYAGKRYDPVRGILRKSWVFVMTLGFSRRSFCALCFDQKIETWIRLHIEAFEHFGGVPRVIVPDNEGRGGAGGLLRRRRSADPAQLSRAGAPLRLPDRPDAAALAGEEGQGRGRRALRQRQLPQDLESTDIVQDQAALERWTMEVSDRRVHGTTARRPIELFEEAERSALIPLPKARFEIVIWKLARLHSDSHVQVDGAFYSAPWKHLHQDLWVRCTRTSIAIWLGEEHLWTHARLPRGGRSTVREHLPEHRRDWCERSRSHWEGRAKRIGPEVEALVAAVFSADDVLTQLRRVQAIVTHLETFPKDRACKAASGPPLRLPRVPRPEKHPAEGTRPRAPPRRARASVVEGARFARRPTESLFAHQEGLHVHH
ncbi:MAG: transposase [Planctomycetes bacterium]|nr:transposase [Planctomycetota bacterium]